MRVQKTHQINIVCGQLRRGKNRRADLSSFCIQEKHRYSRDLARNLFNVVLDGLDNVHFAVKIQNFPEIC